MIIENGTIEFKQKTGGGINPETGYPIKPSTASWSTPQPCNIVPLHENLLAVSSLGTNYRKRTYAVYVEEGTTVISEQVRLRGKDGKELGDFSVIQVEPLEAVGMIRILV